MRLFHKYCLMLITAGLIGSLITGCDNYLDVQPEAEVPAEEFYETAEDAEAALYSMYGVLSHWNIFGGQSWLAASMIPSDDAIAFGFGPLFAFENFNYGANEGRFEAIYRNRYQAINLSNQLLMNIDNIPMDAATKEQYKAEALFLRSIHYFDLVRAFGDVPLVLTNQPEPENTNLRSGRDVVYDQIIEDLSTASEILPASYPDANAGRATKWAALAYQAQVELYRENWSEVVQLTDRIINESGKRLYTERGLESFYYLFRIEQENGIESIFEAQSNAVEGNPEGFNGGRQYGQVIGPTPWGWANVVPTDALAEAFDQAGDSIRKEVTILYAGQVTLDGDTINTNPNAVPTVNPARYVGKAYVPVSVDPARPYFRTAEQNPRLMRYAEVLLMNAEAKAQLGGDAATPLNEVRARVGLPPIANPTVEDVWNERRLELALENERFFDLVRTGKAAEVLGPLGFQTGRNELFPVPQNEITLTDGQLSQNPGY